MLFFLKVSSNCVWTVPGHCQLFPPVRFHPHSHFQDMCHPVAPSLKVWYWVFRGPNLGLIRAWNKSLQLRWSRWEHSDLHQLCVTKYWQDWSQTFSEQKTSEDGLNNINAELFCQTAKGITQALCDIPELSLRGNVDITWYWLTEEA